MMYAKFAIWVTSFFLTGAVAGQTSAKNDCSPDTFVLKSKSRIVTEGDSLTYGVDWNGVNRPINSANERRSRHPYPETLQQLLGKRVAVINHGFPGDRSSDGLERWASFPTPQITILMYGTNDAGNHGKRSSGTLSPIDFNNNLKALSIRRIKDGGTVILLLPPPLKDEASNRRLEAYRKETMVVAEELGLRVLDTPLLLSGVTDKWIDGLHMSEASNEAIAKGLADFFCFEDE